MRYKAFPLILIGLMLSMVIFIGACRRVTTTEIPLITNTTLPTQTPITRTPDAISTQTEVEPTRTVSIPTTEVAYPQPVNQTATPDAGIAYPQPVNQTATPDTGIAYPQPASQTPGATTSVSTSTASPEPPTDQPQIILASATMTPTPTATITPPFAYPAPGVNPTSLPGQGYPGPEYTNTSPAYQSPTPSYTQPSRTPIKSATLSPTFSTTLVGTPTPTPTFGTPKVTPTEQPPRPPLSPPPAGSSVSIWHSFSITKADVLQSVIESFKRLYPSVTFTLLYVPLDDLYNTYYEAAYLGNGPSLLLGPSDWGPELSNDELITNLLPYVPENYLANISPPALSSGKYKDSLISLPLSQHGLLMFRNKALITTASGSMDELTMLAQQATHGGMVGSYLERGSYFSSPAIIGLGGRLMDENGYPAFNDNYGLEWLDLLEAYDQAGAVTFNTNWDLDKFKHSRVGIIIDGSWNIMLLAQSIGIDNLAIDPWPSYGTGHMSGWVETDSIFLNSSTTGNDRFAALSFMGYLLDPNVQMRFAEVGDIPTVMTTQPRDDLIKQAMTAFINGEPYPITQDDSVLTIYRNELDLVIRKVFYEGVDPAIALQTAADNITQTLNEMNSAP